MDKIKPDVIGYVSLVGASSSNDIYSKSQITDIAKVAKEYHLIKPKFRPVYKKESK